MTIRYFKTTDGNATYFRSSPTRVYKSATFHQDYRGLVFHQDGRGVSPVTEIPRSEYAHLMELKRARILAAGKSLDYNSAPSDSWISNADLAMINGEAI